MIIRNEKKIEAAIAALLPSGVIIKSISCVNHKPHPYTIGPRHVSFASDYYGGMLGDDTIRALEKRDGRGRCAIEGGCNLLYNQHTYDKVLFLQLQRHVTNKEMRGPELGALMEASGIDGLAFVETPEKFRVLPLNKNNEYQRNGDQVPAKPR